MNKTLLNIQSYNSWVEQKKVVIYRDILSQSILVDEKAWKPYLTNKPVFLITSNTKRRINELLEVMRLPDPDNDKDISKFLLNPRPSIIELVKNDPLIAKQYIQHRLYQSPQDDKISQLWFVKAEYWLVGDDAREVLKLWTRINRLLEKLEELDFGSKMQIRFKYNGNTYEASILPQIEPVLVSHAELYIEGVKTAIIADEGEKYYRDYAWNLYLRPGKSQWGELRPFFMKRVG